MKFALPLIGLIAAVAAIVIAAVTNYEPNGVFWAAVSAFNCVALIIKEL